MAVVEQQLSFFFSSDTANGAQNVSSDGSEFDIHLNSAIHLPENAVYAYLGVSQASIWNLSPNISSAFSNNQFSFTTSNVASPGVNLLVLPDGLYSLKGFNSYLSTQFSNLGLPSNLITLSGDTSTQKTIFTFLEAGDSVDMTIANSIREVLGFNSRVSPTAPQAAGYADYSDNTANFNRTNSYILQSTLIGQGINLNAKGASMISHIPIDVEPGKQIHHHPQHIVWTDCSELQGGNKSNFRFMLKNQALETISTGGEVYSFSVIIKYGVLHGSSRNVGHNQK